MSEILTDIGRDRARAGGWYDVRRSLQAWVIGSVAAVWAVTVAVAVWRVPERRRRYLPTAIVVFTLVCFVGVRLISLHQVDALLHNHERSRRDGRGRDRGRAPALRHRSLGVAIPTSQVRSARRLLLRLT